MERRVYDRSPIAYQVRVTVPASPEISASGETLDISKSGLALHLPLHLTPGTLVKMEIADSVLYGFVANSRESARLAEPSFARNKSWTGGSELNKAVEPVPEQSFFRIGIEVVEVLIGPSGLSKLLKQNFEDAMPDLQMTYADAS
jgi:PilZ domain